MSIVMECQLKFQPANAHNDHNANPSIWKPKKGWRQSRYDSSPTAISSMASALFIRCNAHLILIVLGSLHQSTRLPQDDNLATTVHALNQVSLRCDTWFLFPVVSSLSLSNTREWIQNRIGRGLHFIRQVGHALKGRLLKSPSSGDSSKKALRMNYGNVYRDQNNYRKVTSRRCTLSNTRWNRFEVSGPFFLRDRLRALITVTSTLEGQFLHRHGHGIQDFAFQRVMTRVLSIENLLSMRIRSIMPLIL